MAPNVTWGGGGSGGGATIDLRKTREYYGQNFGHLRHDWRVNERAVDVLKDISKLPILVAS